LFHSKDSYLLEVFKKNATNEKCNIKKLVEYAVKYPNITIQKRIGLILEENGISDDILKPLAKRLEQTAISSLNNSRKGTINQKWRLIINDSKE
jgi:predicted transcriptional regulator of viral defense system